MELFGVNILDIGIVLISVIYAIVFHEVAHGAAALKLGDPTAKLQKRLTLNPIRHLSFFGSFLLPVILLFLFGGKATLGYAKPVPVDPTKFKNRWRDMGITGAAGPAANFICALIAGLLVRLMTLFIAPDAISTFTIALLNFFAFINIFLGLFNLIPVPPFDGSHILRAFVPKKINEKLHTPLFSILMTVVLITMLFSTSGIQIILLWSKSLHLFISGLPLIL